MTETATDDFVDVFGVPLDEPEATFCPNCGDLVGPVTGLCARCHFAGWWWPDVRFAARADLKR